MHDESTTYMTPGAAPPLSRTTVHNPMSPRRSRFASAQTTVAPPRRTVLASSATEDGSTSIYCLQDSTPYLPASYVGYSEDDGSAVDL